jgi:serine/threonine-protein kinase
VALAVVLVLAALAGGGLYAQRVKLFTPSRAVPDVAGLALPAARQALLRDHFAVIVGPPAYSTTVAGGVALRQQPAPGTVEKQGSAVTVVASKGPPPVTVPSLAGLDCGTAQRLLAVSHLVGVCAPGAQAYSATVPAGQVINWAGNGQANPSTAPEGSSIAIAISKGPPPVPVPNVAGASSSYASATAALQGDGLVPVESQQFSTSVPAGQVVGTNPPVGTTVPHGSTVTVVVSDGPPLVAVPDVIGDSAAQAEAALQGAGLAVGSVYGPAGGTVFITDPAIGKSVHEGSTVNLYTQ